MAVEMLEIKQEGQKVGKSSYSYWTAIKMTPSGDVVVAETPLHKHPEWDDFNLGVLLEYLENVSLGFISATDERAYYAAQKKYNRILEADYRQLLAKLVADGWKPIAKDDHDRVVTMKRDKY